jgi:hypothetical protein
VGPVTLDESLYYLAAPGRASTISVDSTICETRSVLLVFNFSSDLGLFVISPGSQRDWRLLPLRIPAPDIWRDECKPGISHSRINSLPMARSHAKQHDTCSRWCAVGSPALSWRIERIFQTGAIQGRLSKGRIHFKLIARILIVDLPADNVQRWT